ncbi:EAL domain-containing protein [Methyloversatilis sp.]|uniref:EAL domain-containing protein n=1 Tax=Methyloversatilis sp. TaxID=2569862 RepID=UPI0035B2E00C
MPPLQDLIAESSPCRDTGAVGRRLRALIVEDNPVDELHLLAKLRAAGFAVEHRSVDSVFALETALAERHWDIVISDYVLPDCDGLDVLAVVRRLRPDLPFVLVSGGIGEAVAVEAMRAGAQDYLLKQNLLRLGAVVERELAKSAIAREQRAERQKLRESEMRLHSILATLEDIIWSIELPSQKLVYLNPSAESIYGVSAAAFLQGQTDWLDMVHPDDRERMVRSLKEATTSGSLTTEYRIVRPDGETRWILDRARVVFNEHGARIRLDGIARDVTQQRSSEAKLRHAAHFDVLTGLPNRILLNERLQKAIDAAAETDARMAVVFIDLDRFKIVNDSMGHDAGDELLRVLSRRLAQRVRSSDTVARLGGDEFVVLLPEIRQAADAHAVCEQMLLALAPPVTIQNHDIHCTASMGVAVYPQDGRDVATLLRHADAAMYRAKQAGRNTICFHEPDKNAASGVLRLEAELHAALAQEQFELHFQPQVDLLDGRRIIGFEALVRWRHPERGLVSPLDFIPLAEETGLIVPLGEWVLRSACEQARKWLTDFDPELRVAVNVSARQLMGSDIVHAVSRELERSGLPPHNLELELTESMLMQSVGQTVKVLGELKRLGVAVAIDDFGTGYSSLAYLRRFPIDGLKIDASFVRDIGHDADDAAICACILAMAGSLRMQAVAEGVETEEQLAFLRAHGCRIGQGYLFGRPMSAAEATALLRKGAV